MSTAKMVARMVVAMGVATMFTSVGLAAVSAEEAKKLGSSLTEFGADRAANADGSIPKYTGGLSSKTLGPNEDPYKDEKPLYSVDAKNMAEYTDLLTPGTKALLTKYSGYRVDVYPSHRSMRYPAWVLENTVRNATTAKLGGPVKGDNLLGAGENGLPYPGIPFPIPTDGYEVMWNNTAKYVPPVSRNRYSGYLVDTGGRLSPLPGIDGWYLRPWYDRSGTLQKNTPPGTLFGLVATITRPPSGAGGVFMNFYTARGEDGGQKVWFYSPGQRRVRMAPEFAYDVPIAAYGGATIWDEIFAFVGRLDRFDFKLVGKREMLVPYNTYWISSKAPLKEIFGPKYINPDVMRWEKHRVWVVDATRKQGKRHAYSRRMFYIDEDSWCVLVQESYDDAGNMFRIAHTNTNVNPSEVGGIVPYSWQTYDLIKGNYMMIGTLNNPGDGHQYYETPEGLKMAITPQAVEAAGIR